AMLAAYEWTLDKVLKYKVVTLVLTIATLFITVWLYVTIPKGFFPIEDTGFILAVTEGPTDVSFQGMAARQREIAAIVRKGPAVDYLESAVRRGGAQPDQQLRAHVHCAQAKSGGPRPFERDHPAATACGERGAGHQRVFPERAEHQPDRPHHQERISVHGPVERHRGAIPPRA